MNALDPDDLDTDTKVRLFEHVADMVAGAIGATPTKVDPGDSILFVDEWWGEVLVDGYNQMVRIEDGGVDDIVGMHIHGVPVQPDKMAHTPTIREGIETPFWKRDMILTCPECGKTYSEGRPYVTFPGRCGECGADLSDVFPEPVEDDAL